MSSTFRHRHHPQRRVRDTEWSIAMGSGHQSRDRFAITSTGSHGEVAVTTGLFVRAFV